MEPGVWMSGGFAGLVKAGWVPDNCAQVTLHRCFFFFIFLMLH